MNPALAQVLTTLDTDLLGIRSYVQAKDFEIASLKCEIEGMKEQTWGRVMERAHFTSKAKGFWDEDHGPHTTATKLALVTCEVAEALEAARRSSFTVALGSRARDGNAYQNLQDPDKHLPAFTEFEVELADVVIRVMDLAEARSCRLREAIMAKLAFNETRPVMHGGKGF